MNERSYRMGMALSRWMLEAADWLRDHAERIETHCWERVRPPVTVPPPLTTLRDPPSTSHKSPTIT